MLFPSTLVICQNLSQIDPLLAEIGHTTISNNPDIFFVSEYTVENIRQIKKFLSQRPYSHDTKVVIIPQADLLNLESQNTLLKNLEEPGDNNYFILTTSKPNALLPTIISRCQTIKLISSVQSQVIVEFPQTVSQALTFADDIGRDKTAVRPFIDNQISAYQLTLIDHPQNANIIKQLIKSSQMLNANIDPKTVLDFLFLNFIPALFPH